MVMRERLAVKVFAASLIGAVIGFIPAMTDARFKAVWVGSDYGLMIFIFAECLFIFWFARRMLRPEDGPKIGDNFD